MPPDPPREVPPSAVALSVPKKNPTFSQNLIGSTALHLHFFGGFTGLTLSVPQDFHGCTQPFFIYAQNIMVYNLTAHNYVSLKDNPNKVCIKLKKIGCTL